MVGLALLLGATPALLGQSPEVAANGAAVANLKFEQLADNFYVFDESAYHGGSISVLIGPDGVLIVDSGTADLAPAAEREIRRLSPEPVRFVINTHSHVDETGGNEHFARLGATIIGREQARHRMLNPRSRGSGSSVRESRQERAPSPEGAPSLTFDSAISLHFNAQSVRLIPAADAHTDNDTIVLFPQLDILVVGDLLRPGEYPSINGPDGGSFPGMIQALATLLELAGPRTRIVTSHGQIVGREAIERERHLLFTTRDRILALKRQGRTVDEVVLARITEDLGAKAPPGRLSAEAFVRDMYNELESSS